MAIYYNVERRRHLRAYIPISVSIRSNRYLIADDGILQNLSEGGALVACREHYEVSETLRVVMHLPGGGDFHVTAQVSRTCQSSDDTYSIALNFAPLPVDTAKHIDELVRSEAANRSCRSVLVTDDSPAHLRQIADQLIMRGYRPLLAATALQATTWLETEQASIVMVLVGQGLLSGSTEALLEWLSDSYPALHRARWRSPINGTSLQRALDRVASTKAPEEPWVIGRQEPN